MDWGPFIMAPQRGRGSSRLKPSQDSGRGCGRGNAGDFLGRYSGNTDGRFVGSSRW